MSEDVDEFSEVIESNFLEMKSFLVRSGRTVLLTSEKVEWVLSSKEGFIIKDFDRRHPVWSEVASDLFERKDQRNWMANVIQSPMSLIPYVKCVAYIRYTVVSNVPTHFKPDTQEWS